MDEVRLLIVARFGSDDSEEFPCDILGPFFYEGDVLAEPLPITAGSARPLERPGLGVELDEALVARYRVD